MIAPLLYVTFVNPLTGQVPDLTHHPFPELAKTAFSGGLDTTNGLAVRQQAAAVAMRVAGLLYVDHDDVCLLSPSQEQVVYAVLYCK